MVAVAGGESCSTGTCRRSSRSGCINISTNRNNCSSNKSDDKRLVLVVEVIVVGVVIVVAVVKVVVLVAVIVVDCLSFLSHTL